MRMTLPLMMNNPVTTDTIAAVSTPPGKGGVALIRISGPAALQVVAGCFVCRSGLPVDRLPPRRATYGSVLLHGEEIDDALLTLFPAPHSYTGEDTAEISCHGGLLITRRVLEAVLLCGARMAEPGEFTRRALLNGRMSLSEAEDIGRLLDAATDAQLRLCAPAARSRLAGEIADMRDILLRLLGSLWANIDYPEEDLAELSDGELLCILSDLIHRMHSLAATYQTGRAIREGIPAVLCGAPNVGKSSLYNLLCGEERAIVTEHAGTTRDVLETDVALGRVLLHLSDTAGLRESADPIERIGIDRAHACLSDAALILAVFDGSRPLQQDDRRLLSALQTSPAEVIACINKSDLPARIEEEEIRATFPRLVHLSAKDRQGLSALQALVEADFTDGKIAIGQDAVIADARQHAALSRACALTEKAADAFAAGLPADAASSDLELALGALGELDGRAVSEEIVSEIFRHFCVGK